MSVERNKEIARAFFARFSASDIHGALELMADEATWSIPGKPERMPTAGLYEKQRIAKLFQRMLDRLENGLAMTVKSAIGEGHSVALEIESSGDLKNGRRYRQEYHMLMEFQDGKILRVREYLDTQHAYDVWISSTP